jgi:hypothetical protein
VLQNIFSLSLDVVKVKVKPLVSLLTIAFASTLGVILTKMSSRAKTWTLFCEAEDGPNHWV